MQMCIDDILLINLHCTDDEIKDLACYIIIKEQSESDNWIGQSEIDNWNEQSESVTYYLQQSYKY